MSRKGIMKVLSGLHRLKIRNMKRIIQVNDFKCSDDLLSFESVEVHVSVVHSHQALEIGRFPSFEDVGMERMSVDEFSRPQVEECLVVHSLHIGLNSNILQQVECESDVEMFEFAIRVIEQNERPSDEFEECDVGHFPPC